MASLLILGILGGLGVPELLIFFCIPVAILIYQITKADIETEFINSNQIIYAGFWLRIVAALIDGILIFILTSIVAIFCDISIPLNAQGPFFGQFYIFQHPISWFIAWIYHSSLECSVWQGSLGKRILKIKVTDIYGHKIGFWRATGRYWGRFISFFTLCIGIIMIAFTKRKQALHDKMANCLVVLGSSFLKKNQTFNLVSSNIEPTTNNNNIIYEQQTHSNPLEGIKNKERLLFNSLKNNLITDIEYSEKSKKLKEEKEAIIIEQDKTRIKNLAINRISEKAKQLEDLVKAGLLTKQEYTYKYNILLSSEIEKITTGNN